MWLKGEQGKEREKDTFLLSFQQSSCSYNSKYKGVEISGSVQIKSGDEFSLMAAVANAGPVAVGVDASSKSFRVCVLKNVVLQRIHFFNCACVAVLLLWCVQSPRLLQLLADTRNGCHWLWHL